MALDIRDNSDMRQVLRHRGEDGLWVAECPTLPGCVSQGSDQQVALENIKEAITAYIAALEADSLSVPEEPNDDFLELVRSRSREQEVLDVLDENPSQ